MGNSQGHERNGKEVIEIKLKMSAKTGVLNLSGQSLSLKSSTWSRLACHDFVNKLTSLDLSKNPLKQLPREILSLTLLKTINLADCQLSSLLDLSNLSNLTTLNISHNSLSASGVDQLPSSLVKVDLSFNQLQCIPGELFGCYQITELNLSNNLIENLNGIGVLINITHLYLDHNRLSELPDEIGSLSQLKFLSLKCNLLCPFAESSQRNSLPPELFLNTCLDHLELEGNIGLTNASVLKFVGIDAYLTRRQQTKDKGLQGGALLNYSLFGLD